ncbi:DUF6037 family protein [Acinetobacter tandoii]|uniref:DUF6037 family protein n=1 Tax=Acinetobacter tandoii TaxID=202954 RepID=UPI0040459DBD
MQLTGLIPLFESMKSQKIQRYKFEFKRNNVSFDVIFFTDSSPYILLFGARGHNFSFEIEVHKGFRIKTMLDKDIFKKLQQVLGLQFDPNNKFSMNAFFEDFNKKIPAIANFKNVPKPHEIALYSRDVEESHKIYFMGWLDNTIRGDSVTEKNLEKTERLLGYKTYLTCKSKNLSSRWTDQEHLAKEFINP